MAGEEGQERRRGGGMERGRLADKLLYIRGDWSFVSPVQFSEKFPIIHCCKAIECASSIYHKVMQTYNKTFKKAISQFILQIPLPPV